MAKSGGYLGNSNLKRVGTNLDWTPEMITEWQKCADDPVYFTKKYIKIIHVDKGMISFLPYDYQEEIIQTIHDNRYTIALTGRQNGKALSIDEKIPTPNGFKSMGDIVAGDLIFDNNGNETKVTFATDVMYGHECYNMKFDNGDIVKCDSEHLWVVEVDNTKITRTTKELIPILKRSKSVGQSVRIRNHDGVDYKHRDDLLISPYMFGYWLGDGTRSSGRFTIADYNYEFIKSKFESFGYIINDFKRDTRVKHSGYFDINGFVKILKSENVFLNKHIPEKYIFSSKSQRIELIRGLMDSDGSVNKTGHCEFYNKNELIIDSFRNILSSLGVISRKRLKTIKGQIYYTVSFTTDKFIPVSLPSKFERIKTPEQRNSRTTYNDCYFIKSIEECDSVPVRCIKVDSPDSMFLASPSYIPTHNTTSLVAAITHYVTFNDEKTVALLANKGDTAREILNRIQIAYENLPEFMQHGILEYNKGSMVLENKSRIIAASTSSSAIRGFSISFLYIDECVEGDTLVTIRTSYGIISKVRIDCLYNEKNLSNNQFTDDLQVLTENGFKDFDGIKRTSAKTIRIEFNDGSELKSTESHLIKVNDKFIEVSTLQIGDIVNKLTIKSISTISNDDRYVYDLLNVADGHHYITNNVTSHNCAFVENWDEFYKAVYPTISSGTETKVVFTSTPAGINHYHKLWKDAVEGRSSFIPIKVTWRDVPGRDEEWKRQTIANTSEEAFTQEHEAEFIGSAGTLIDGWRLKELVEDIPVKHNKFLRQYKEVEEGHIYVVVADVSRGKGIDNSAFIVVDVTTLPYQVVSTYYCDSIPPDMFSEVIFQAYDYYNKAFVLVENNDAGCETLRVLNDIYECETLLGTTTDTQNRKVISINGGKDFEFGVRTTKTVKSVGCSRIKQLIENYSFLFGDKWLIDELNKFIRVGSSYEAQKEAHDDLAMCSVLFGWLTTQYLFQDLTSIDTRFIMREQFDSRFDDELLPFAIMDGLNSYGDDTYEYSSIELPDYENMENFDGLKSKREKIEDSFNFF